MNKKNILIVILILAILAAFWKWHQTREHLKLVSAQYGQLEDSLRNFKSSDVHVLYFDSTGGSTTTVVALDKVNNSGIGGVTVTIKKKVGTIWTSVASGTTASDGVYNVGANIGGAGTYRVRCVNGVKDDQTQQFTNTVLGRVGFFLAN